MKLLRGEAVSGMNDRTCVTIGKFDGIHRGHRHLIENTISAAVSGDLKSCLFTFDSMPDSITGPDYKVLTSREEKEIIFEKLGLDIVVEYPFSDSFRALMPEEFVKSILVDKINMKALVVGSDFRFGRDNIGTVRTLEEMSDKYGFKLFIVQKEEYEDVEISSSRIKAALQSGDLIEANRMLGYEYIISGVTKSGNKLGRTIGVPTMNIYPDQDKLLPAYGVYAGTAIFRGRDYSCVVNIGVRPTVDDVGRVSVETNLLDYIPEETETYDEELTVRFLYRIRPEIKFGSMEELFIQIEKDVEEAKILLAK